MLNNDGHEFSGKTLLATIHSGYVGTPEKWLAYFELVIKHFEYEGLEQALVLARNTFRAGTYEVLLNDIEHKKRLFFPKSYRDFLIAGGLEFIDYISKNALEYYEKNLLFSLGDVGRFKDISKEQYLSNFYGAEYERKVIDELYYRYDRYEEGNFTADGGVKPSCLNFIQIGVWYDSPGVEVYGLVDSELTSDGEYEMWVVCLGGEVYRYRSFGACK